MRLKWMYLAGAAAAACSSVAFADALHGFCSDCAVDQTIGGVMVTSTGTNPPMDFGFWSGGTALNGTYFVDILTPDNGGSAPAGAFDVAIKGGASDMAPLFSTSPWTDQGTKLDTYLGFTVKTNPENPLSAWLPATMSLDSMAKGYWVYQANLGTQTLGTSTNTGPMLSLSGLALPQGSVIVGFLESTSTNGGGKTTTDITATANSGALFETDPPPKGVPEPGTAALLATALVGFGMRMFRRRTPRSLSAA
jgi:hypothetical protein